MPWNEDMTGRPSFPWTATPLAFMPTSSRPSAAPRAIRASPSASTSGASAGSGSRAQQAVIPVLVTALLPIRTTSCPAAWRDSNAPPAMPSRARPSGPVLAWTCASMAGTRDTQLPKMTPSQKKMSVIAARALDPQITRCRRLSPCPECMKAARKTFSESAVILPGRICQDHSARAADLQAVNVTLSLALSTCL